MNLTLEYRNTARERAAHLELLHGRGIERGRAENVKGTLYIVVLLTLAIYATWTAEQIFLACVFSVSLVWYAWGGLNYAHRTRRSLLQAVAELPDHRIHLEMGDDGLKETVEGVASFVPWGGVKGYTRFQDILFLRLAAELWAIIPEKELEPPSAGIQEILTVLEEHGIKEERPATLTAP